MFWSWLGLACITELSFTAIYALVIYEFLKEFSIAKKEEQHTNAFIFVDQQYEGLQLFF